MAISRWSVALGWMSAALAAPADDVNWASPIATVNGVAIPRYNIEAKRAAIAEFNRRPRNGVSISLPELRSDIQWRARKGHVQGFITEEVLAQEARKRGMVVSDEEVETKAQYYREHADKRMTIAAVNTDDELRAHCRRNLIHARVLASQPEESPPSDEELRSFYAAKPHIFQERDQIRAVDIVMDQPDPLMTGPTQREREARQKQNEDEAREVAQRFKQRPGEFETEAAKLPNVHTESNGAEWKYAGSMDGTAWKMLLDSAVREGDVVGPVYVGPFYGHKTVHFYKLLERRYARLPAFEEVEHKVLSMVRSSDRSKREKDALAALVAAAEVQCLDPSCVEPHPTEAPPWVVPPPPIDAALRARVESASYCAKDSDCVMLGEVCPIGCNVTVNRREARALERALRSSPPRCKLSCAAPPELECRKMACHAAATEPAAVP